MADSHSDLPFKAEYAKSSRASCKGCKLGISKDTLRLALMIQSPHFDGKVPNWFHYQCFWRRARVSDVSEIHGFDALRWEDQQKIKTNLQGDGGALSKGKGESTDFKTEYAKSNRSTCRGCEEKIEKDEVRIAKKDFESERSKMYGPQDAWYHVDCFIQDKDELDFDIGAKMLKGFKQLRKEDKEMLVSKLGKGDKKKRKAASLDETDSKAKKIKTEESVEDKALREQSQIVWTLRDELQRQVSNEALKGLLDYNGQDIPSGEARLLDRVSDGMVFGCPQPCCECGGQLVHSTEGYRCTGNVTSWTKCMNITKTPKRRSFKVPEEYRDVLFLKKYKYVKRDRVFSTTIMSTTQGLVSAAAESGEKPLFHMRFAIIGKLSKSKQDVAKTIQGLGGTVVDKIDKSVAACISTPAEVEKSGKKIQDAKKADVHVVSQDFLEGVQKGGAVLKITQYSIASWGSDPQNRVGKNLDNVDGTKKKSGPLVKKESHFTKSVPSTVKMVVKGGAAVDPESGLTDRSKVYEHKGDIYNAVLGMVDIVRGTNSYYKLQILESEKSSRFWVFRAWGRVGTTIGGNKLEQFSSAMGAVQQFKSLYGEKTGNDWSNRKNFEKVPHKFYPLEIDYGQEEIKGLEIGAGSNSDLAKPIQDLVRMIFDVESMKKAMLEFEIDLKKMPLGKLSKKQIETAYRVLSELQMLIEDKGSTTKFLDASNRFYTLIPHDFGMRKPPLLDSAAIIKQKTDMLDSLLEIEIAYHLLKTGAQDGKDPIDTHYGQLKTKIEVLDKTADEFSLIEEYVRNTHAITHNQYDLQITQVFKIAREGEKSRYRPFRDLPNKMMLWHGSHTTNYAGILSQGLRIAPPEAPVTGYMFGKGIYFADMVSKSGNYCRTSPSDPTGLLILCEVALGNIYERTAADYIKKLPKGKHSCKGLGMTAPDPANKHITKDGVEIPKGKGVTSADATSLLYNEYIVYDVAQVNMKYMVQLDFKWKSPW